CTDKELPFTGESHQGVITVPDGNRRLCYRQAGKIKNIDEPTSCGTSCDIEPIRAINESNRSTCYGRGCANRSTAYCQRRDVRSCPSALNATTQNVSCTIVSTENCIYCTIEARTGYGRCRFRGRVDQIHTVIVAED